MPETSRIASALSDRYVIEREIGAGGMATVYLARDVKHDRDVALKILRADLSAVLGGERFLNEVRITARLDHPHILTLIDSGEADGILYYVLPFVRGESLRAKLEREKQLSLEEALSIARQIAGALDYAHQHGVVHRDIKPENILLHEGEAMLADFGIALAVKEAGGNRLTETGLSLGTPQYMSPEQATGDRQLDARSDVYSLGAVLYEMLAGEPPVTGPTAQAMIAKLITERPTRLRVVRDTVPEGIDNAVAKALSKVPADRFVSAGDFMRAVGTVRASSSGAPRPRSRVSGWAIALVALVVVAIGAWLAARAVRGGGGPPVVLRDRTQVTFTGAVEQPSLSPDGKQIAFLARTCTTSCTYGVEVQDVGGTTTRQVMAGATAGYGVWWSPDRRYLGFAGTFNGRYGSFIVSALGGPPRFVSSGGFVFFAGGDSLMVSPSAKPDTAFVVRVTTLDGAVADSFRIAEAGTAFSVYNAIPGTAFFLALVGHGARGLWLVLDRHGVIQSRFENDCLCPGTADSNAVWLESAQPGRTPVLLRMGFARGTGRLASHADTVYSGTFASFSVTANGGMLLLGEGSYDYSVWGLDLADAMRGRFPDARRLARASTSLSGRISPDGSRVLLVRQVPTTGNRLENRVSVVPFAGGTETAINGLGQVFAAFWQNDSSIAVAIRQPDAGLRFAVVDVATGTQRNVLQIPDSLVADLDAIGTGGWAWIPTSADRVIIEQQGRRRTIPMPSWFNYLIGVDVSPDSRALNFSGWNRSTYDSVGIEVTPLDSLAPVHWYSMFSEGGGGIFRSDGSMIVFNRPSQLAGSLMLLRGPGRSQPLGIVPRPVQSLAASDDQRRVSVNIRDYHGDAWLSRVVRP